MLLLIYSLYICGIWFWFIRVWDMFLICWIYLYYFLNSIAKTGYHFFLMSLYMKYFCLEQFLFIYLLFSIYNTRPTHSEDYMLVDI